MKPKFQLLFSLPEQTAVETIAVAFEAPYAFIATSSSLWQIDDAFSSAATLKKIPLPKGEIQNLYRYQDGLYLLKRTIDDGSGDVLLRSTDHAATFAPIDAGLIADEAGFKTKLTPTRMATSANLKFINAGAVATSWCQMTTVKLGRFYLACSPIWLAIPASSFFEMTSC